MLDVQRPPRRANLWLMPAVTMPRALPSRFRGRGTMAALGLVALIWVAVAQLVDTPYVRIGLMLDAALLLAGGAGLTSMAARSRRATAAEVASVAHDLRGPLITLQATLELLASDGFGALPEEARAVALQAAAASSRAAGMVDLALDWTTRRPGTAPRSLVDLNHVLQQAVDALAAEVRATGATVEVASLPRVAGDPSALFRVFLNLLQNGLKYHQPGTPPCIAITAELRDGWGQIAVSDAGIGIAPAERSLVFARHYRTAAGIARATGEGLGLAIVHRLVTEMGGMVWVDGTASPGTTFLVRLPLA